MENNGAQECALKVGDAQCRDDKSQKIMLHRCMHLNLALCNAELVTSEKIRVCGCVHLKFTLCNVNLVMREK